MKNDAVYKSMKSTTQKLADSFIEDATAILEDAGLHTLTHEFVHAGAAAFMKNNPEHVASKRILDIFNKVQHPRYKAKFAAAGVNSEYWETNVDKFLAEALSNPKLMLALQDIELTYDSMLATAFKWIVDAALRLIGFKKSGTAYTYVLDSFAAIMEAQKLQNETEAKDPTVIKASVNVMDIIASAVPELVEHIDDDLKAKLQKIQDETPELLAFAVDNAKGCL